MNSTGPSGPTLGTLIRAALPAFVLAALAAYALRLADVAFGVRLSAAFFLFVILQNFFFERITGFRRSAPRWAGTVALALVAAAAIWFVAGR